MVLTTIYDENSPSGLAHLKVSRREDTQDSFLQDLKIGDNFDTSQMIELRYFIKFDAEVRIAKPYNKMNVNFIDAVI